MKSENKFARKIILTIVLGLVGLLVGFAYLKALGGTGNNVLGVVIILVMVYLFFHLLADMSGGE